MSASETGSHPFHSPEIAAAFDAHAAGQRGGLLHLRDLILDTAAQTAGVGRLEEALKWGQASYLTPETKSGSTVRVGVPKQDDDTYALYFHCQTDLVATFRRLYPDVFTFEGNRAIRFRAGDTLPEAELKHCISLALTYHLNRKRT